MRGGEVEPLNEFFIPEDQLRILSSIDLAERKSSGEIRVRVERSAGKDIMKTARKAFKMLGMRKTKQRNGILFFFAVEERQFVILGDKGINNVVPDTFWDDIRDLMQRYFGEGFFAKGLSEGIKLTGYALSKYFPHQRDDINELPDAISFGE